MKSSVRETGVDHAERLPDSRRHGKSFSREPMHQKYQVYVAIPYRTIPAGGQRTEDGGRSERMRLACRPLSSVIRSPVQTCSGSGCTHGLRYGRASSRLASSSPTTWPLSGSQVRLRPSLQDRLARMHAVAVMAPCSMLETGWLRESTAVQEVPPVPAHGSGDVAFQVLLGLVLGVLVVLVQGLAFERLALALRDELVLVHVGLERALVAVDERRPRGIPGRACCPRCDGSRRRADRRSRTSRSACR